MHKGLAVFAVMAACLTGCFPPPGTPPGAVVGRYDGYDYSPSVIQNGDVRQFWWCGASPNPADSSQDADSILYESIDTKTGRTVGPKTVLAETPGAWDSEFTCNPHVIRGVFTNPLGNGQVYSYALYYVGVKIGTNNSIGVAFSNDGIAWKKYPSPVVPASSPSGYGSAQPVPYNNDKKQAITLFYEDDDPSGPVNTHIQLDSADGIHFTRKGVFTEKGLDVNSPNPSWGDMALDPTGKFWYAAFNMPLRDPATTSNIIERGPPGWQLYRIPREALLTGSSGWQLVKNFDTNLNGHEVVSLVAILGDGFGNVSPGEDPGGQMTLFPSLSNPVTPWNADEKAAGASGDFNRWDILQTSWSSADPSTVDLNRYKNSTTHIVTTGWTDPDGGFALEKSLGKIYVAPQDQAGTPLFGCKAGSTDYFLSLDALCEGQRVLGINGYIYPQQVSGTQLAPIYRCATAKDHFVSQDAQCEGAISQGLLGYVLQ